jgi:hypothetical protein
VANHPGCMVVSPSSRLGNIAVCHTCHRERADKAALRDDTVPPTRRV